MRNFFSLQGQTILVTGALGGIGIATARVLLEQGAAVILTDKAEVDDVLIDELGSEARAAVCEVTNREAVKLLQQQFPVIDGLVLAAGILPFDDWMENDWNESFKRVMEINVLGGINLVRAYFPQMCARGSGRIVFVGSAAGRMGGMQAGPHYVASKGAVHALVRWFSQRAAPKGVCVNGIAPGSIATDMLAGQAFDANRVPMGRMGTVHEVAWPIAFLCSPASGYMNGAVVDVNGGLAFS